MPADPNIGNREREILTAIVETFISTGEPVGSRTLARSNREGLSPASIRNVMADLSDAGFLEQPHASAGRVPTTGSISLLRRADLRQGAAGATRRDDDFRLSRGHHRRAGVHGAHLARAIANFAERWGDGRDQRSRRTRWSMCTSRASVTRKSWQCS